MARYLSTIGVHLYYGVEETAVGYHVHRKTVWKWKNDGKERHQAWKSTILAAAMFDTRTGEFEKFEKFYLHSLQRFALMI